MSEWDFLWELSGQDLVDAMSSGGTKEDWAFVEEQQRKAVNKEWEKLKSLRDNREITREEFILRKSYLFNNK